MAHASSFLRPALACALAASAFAWNTSADTGSVPTPLELTRTVQAGGGGRSTGGSFTLEGTIGQVTASSMAGGSFSIASGFWPANQDYCTMADVN